MWSSNLKTAWQTPQPPLSGGRPCPARMRLLIYLFVALAFVCNGAYAAEGGPAIRFSHSFNRHYAERFIEPVGIAVDGDNNEIYVIDSGLKKVFIFDLRGTPVFSFGSKESGGVAPVDIAVKNGRIYISQEGKGSVGVFNYKGALVGSLSVPGGFAPGAIVVDDDGMVYVVNKSRTNCLVFDGADDDADGASGKFRSAIGEGLKSLSGVAVGKDRVYLITPVDSRAVHVYGKDGVLLFSFEGLEGEGGTLGIPIAAKVDRLENLWVLDSIKGIIVYNKEGYEVSRVVMPAGTVEGQLFFPVDFDIDANDMLYVAEKGAKRVSVFKIER